jgi:RNA polymerase sigma-70 factor (ECF subfamily)
MGAKKNPESSAHDVTGLLRAWSEGDTNALDRLAPLIYAELRRLARRYMAGEKPGHALETTELVHEAYLRLLDVRSVSWQDRAHFFAVSARFMRRILVDFARSRQRLKRQGGAADLPLDEVILDQVPSVSSQPGRELVALDEALQALTAIDARKGQVVELRFFGGLTTEETAAVLKISPETVLRDWKLARAWILRELKAGK